VITSRDYVENVMRTASGDMPAIKERLMKDETINLLHAAIGLVTEAAELTDMLKKHIFYGRDIDKINAQEEVGDALWHAGLAVDVLKTTMDDIMTKNIAKLQERYPEKFDEHKAMNRDISKELKVFEGSDAWGAGE